MTETPDQLPALDRAALDEGHNILSYAGGIIISPTRRAFVEALETAYRAKQLVLIGPDAVEKVARAICNAHCEEMYGVIDSHMVENEWADWIPEATAAIAALGVK